MPSQKCLVDAKCSLCFFLRHYLRARSRPAASFYSVDYLCDPRFQRDQGLQNEAARRPRDGQSACSRGDRTA